VGASREDHDVELGNTFIEVKTSAQDVYQLSFQQILAGCDTSFLFALVSIDSRGSDLLAGAQVARGGIHPIVSRCEREIKQYLRNHGVSFEKALLRRLSAALGHCTVEFHRLRPLAGWRTAFQKLQGFGRIAVLRQECDRSWFVAAQKPKETEDPESKRRRT
jgi:hypothetical protein